MECGKCGGAQDVDANGYSVAADPVDEGPAHGVKTDILVAIGSGDDQQDVNLCAGQSLWEPLWIAELSELPFESAGLSECGAVGIAEGFPGPGENAGIVAGDFEYEVLESVGSDPVVPDQGLFGEKLPEGGLAPLCQGALDAGGDFGIGLEGVVEESFEVPA